MDPESLARKGQILSGSPLFRSSSSGRLMLPAFMSGTSPDGCKLRRFSLFALCSFSKSEDFLGVPSAFFSEFVAVPSLRNGRNFALVLSLRSHFEPLAGAGDFPGVLTKVVSTGRNFALSVSDWRKTSL